MLDMYRIADSTGGLGISEDTFPRKDLAKLARDDLNAKHNGGAENDEKPRFVICRGADHRRGMTDGNDHTRRPKWL
ncbi:hypothetical protein LCGC14_2071400 [marine sediment metagenome]|uniref:Uncharacterized protein n=1 Tax=marine sediment metagenome TaxID=412755 RepID=A0A0F9F5Q2_9ZZZZ